VNIVVDNLLTSYKLSGKGKLVLLLHGWGDSAEGLAGLHKQLAAEYKVLTLDLPGFGSTQAPKTSWNLDDYAAFLRAVLDKLELAQVYAVIGHSNGGALAIRATGLGRLDTQKLVLLATSGVRTGGKGKRLVLKILAKTGNIATVWMPERYRRGLRQSLYDAAGSDMLAVPGMQETFKRVVRQDVQKDAANIDKPALLIYAKDDPAVPLADGQNYHRLIKGSRLETLPDSGHFVHLEQPARVAKLIQDFLK
jgi:pimeloyl-ACP methyl ester carboxylesterase